jgi:hypothetical protein
MPLLSKNELRNVLAQVNKDGILKASALKIVTRQFVQIKKELLDAFNNHPVTQEIEEAAKTGDGEDAPNLSGTLGGVTNLFTFIGFYEGDDPIEPVREILENIEFDYEEINSGNYGYQFNFALPSPEEIFSVTPMPWAEGRSWAKGIESGISGLGYYLRGYKKGSRSGGGIQGKYKVRDNIRFRNVPYISQMLKEAEKKLQRLKAIQ